MFPSFKRQLESLSVALLPLFFLTVLMWQPGDPILAQAKGVQGAKGDPAPEKGTTGVAIPPDLSGKNILVLHAFDSNLPIFELTDRGLKATFGRDGVNIRNQFFEYLDLARNPDPRHRKLLVEQMRVRYGHRRFDMIVTMYPEALEFVLEDCKDIFSGTLILALYLPNLSHMPKTDRRIIGLFPTRDIIGTLEIAMKLVPGAKRAYVVSGAHKVDREGEDQARLISKKWEGRLEFLYLSHLPIEEILATVSQAPPGSIILELGFLHDVTGKEQTTREVAQQLSRVSPVPVFGILDVALGYGIAGGSLLSFEFIGTKAGQLALDILGGTKSLDHIPAILEVPSVPMFDWRQLRRWKLSEAALPEGSIVINKELTLWDFRYYLIGALAFGVAEAALIFFLLMQRRQRKKAEDSVKKAEAKYRDIFEGALEGIFESLPEGKPLMVNPAMAKMLGYDFPEEFTSAIRDSAKQVFADPDKRAEFVRLLEEQDKVFRFECELLRRNGTKIWGEISARRVCGPDGKTLYYSGLIEDITERKRAEAELRKYQEHLEEMVKERTAELVEAMDQAEAANRAKSVFLANMSHELRTPLTSILGIAQLMERDHEFSPKQRGFLEILSRSGHQLFELIDDILEMSKIEAGLTDAVSKTFDLLRFLDDLKEMVNPRAEKKGLRLIFERDSALPRYIQTDGGKLRQILLNLLGNAIKFTEKGGVTLRVNLKEDRDRVLESEPASRVRLEFEVEDTGIGIAPEDMERIFEPFVQLQSAQRPSGGIGLGLAICRKFASAMGGEITVRSQVGRGSTFKLEIGVQPAERSDLPAREVSRRVTGIAPGQLGYCLLVVDDHAESRVLLRQMLEPVGFRVLEAAGGQEAIDLSRKDQPHLVWMDIRMSGMDGYEAARRIREAERERRKGDGQEIHTPIIALTAGVMENKESSPLAGVFDDWVYKPFREREIFEKLEKHLGVRFVSQPSVSSAGRPDRTRDQAELTPADLSFLPPDWLKEFFQTLKTGRSTELLNLIDRIRPEHVDLARALAEMVRNHQFGEVFSLTQEALKEKANG